jgi:hypothetical protein
LQVQKIFSVSDLKENLVIPSEIEEPAPKFLSLRAKARNLLLGFVIPSEARNLLFLTTSTAEIPLDVPIPIL